MNILKYSLQQIDNCPKEAPIRYNNNCQVRYCNENEYLNGICIIDNEIIADQWLNRIEKVTNGEYYKYAIPIYHNNILVILSYPYDSNPTSDVYKQTMFYAIKQDGRPYLYDSVSQKFMIGLILSLEKIPVIKFFFFRCLFENQTKKRYLYF